MLVISHDSRKTVEPMCWAAKREKKKSCVVMLDKHCDDACGAQKFGLSYASVFQNLLRQIDTNLKLIHNRSWSPRRGRVDRARVVVKMNEAC